jgi:ribonuclease J
MLKNIEIAGKLGYLNINESMIVSVEKANSLPPKKLVVIGTGSQGEPMSALSRISAGTHKFFKVHKGDTVIITASVIPGNERMVYNVVNGLMRLGVEVHYERDPDIHVSGHGSEEELKLMLSIVRPKFFMPIHGEYKHLVAHTKIAELLGIKPSMMHIANNGDIMELTSKSFKKSGVINLSQIYVDGQEIGNLESSLITDRQTMSTEGIIFITIVTSDGMLIREPEIQTRGLVGVKNVKVLNTIRHDAEKEAHRLLAKHYGPREVEMEVTKHMKNSVYKLVRRNPLINVQVVDI